MARYQAILAYDGSDFCGFQRQAKSKGRRSVQGELEGALRRLGWQGKAVLFAGRTDAGVHACGQVVAFDLDWAHDTVALQAALNAYLPRDVAVRRVSLASPDFHPRYRAKARRYRYHLFCDPVRDPLRERYAWRVWPSLAREPLCEATASLLGTHDFAAFGSPPRRGGNTVRTVFQAEWETEGQEGWTFTITANAFLLHMVRRVVGLLVTIGQGKRETEAVQTYLRNPSGEKVRFLAPPQGLTLLEVLF